METDRRSFLVLCLGLPLCLSVRKKFCSFIFNLYFCFSQCTLYDEGELKEMPDKILHKKVRMAEDEFFRNLFMDYYSSLLSFAIYYVENETVAEDLVQDIFVKLWENQERWSQVDDFSAYIYQMVRFKCFDYLRAEKVRDAAKRTFTEELDITEINHYIEEEAFRLVVNSLDALPPACRAVFSLALEGYKAKDIAEQLDIAVETVKKQKQLARKILKEKLGKLLLFLPPLF